MEYSYVATNEFGAKQKGIIDAASEHEVVAYLRSNKLLTLSIKSQQSSLIPSILNRSRITNSDTVIFTRQLSTMITTGLTLIESLKILEKQITNPAFKKIIGEVTTSISEGNSLSQALSAHPKVFSKVYIALIRAAETGGLMDKILGRLADNLEKSEDLKKAVRSALFYPAIIVIGIVVVVGIMDVFVIPSLGGLYTSLNVKLPATTQFILSTSSFTTHYYLIVFAGVIALYIGYIQFKKTDSGIRTIDKLSVKIPVLGQIIQLSILNEICRTLSILISSGSTIIDSLTITADVAGNVWYREALLNTVNLVEKGIATSDAMDGQSIFPPIMIQMTKVGESTGKVDDSLLRVADYFDRDLNLRVKTLTTAIEPLLIVVLGVTVGFLIFSVITPIYSIISSIQ